MKVGENAWPANAGQMRGTSNQDLVMKVKDAMSKLDLGTFKGVPLGEVPDVDQLAFKFN